MNIADPELVGWGGGGINQILKFELNLVGRCTVGGFTFSSYVCVWWVGGGGVFG